MLASRKAGAHRFLFKERARSPDPREKKSDAGVPTDCEKNQVDSVESMAQSKEKGEKGWKKKGVRGLK